MFIKLIYFAIHFIITTRNNYCEFVVYNLILLNASHVFRVEMFGIYRL